MPTWAKRGVQTALVTGGLLMLGTSIASAGENVNPDQPPSPIDGGLDAPLPQIDQVTDQNTAGVPGIEAAGAHGTTTQMAPASQPTEVDHVIGLGGVDQTATRTGGDVTGSSEWGVLSGDLTDPSPPLDATMFRVPLDVLGRAIDQRAPIPATDEDEPQFGPSDAADSLLRVDQVPVLGDLYTIPQLRQARLGAPMSTLDQTQVFPAIGGFGRPALSALSTPDTTRQVPAPAELTRRLPAVTDGAVLPAQRVQSHPAIRPVTPARPAAQARPSTQYQPMTGDLPAAGQLGGLPGVPPVGTNVAPPAANLPALPTGAAPVSANLPTLTQPQVPSLPPVNTNLPTRSVPTLSPQSAPAVPPVGVPSSPAGAPPVSANLPVLSQPSLPAASVPAVPAAGPALPALPNTAAPRVSPQATPAMPAVPDLPPVPTLPAMPPIPGHASPQDLPVGGPSLPGLPGLPNLPAPKVSGPSVPAPAPSTQDLFTPAVPVAGQNVPAGATQQLMAQLRGLISDLENTASGSPNRMHPMQEPPAL